MPPEADTYAPVGLRIRADGTVEDARIPPGTVIFHAADDPPDGFLECNGQLVSRLAYPDLFAAIGLKYDPGAGPDVFRLPLANDGKFIRCNTVAGGMAGSDTHEHDYEFITDGHDHGVIVGGTTQGPSSNQIVDANLTGLTATVPSSLHVHNTGLLGGATGVDTDTGGGVTDGRFNVPRYLDLIACIKT
jgi:microcystin-dependent protein